MSILVFGKEKNCLTCINCLDGVSTGVPKMNGQVVILRIVIEVLNCYLHGCLLFFANARINIYDCSNLRGNISFCNESMAENKEGDEY